LLKAINILKKKNIELVIIGKGENRDQLEEYIQYNNLKNNVKLLGYKKNPFPYIKQADIFILTSKFEGSPNVLVEALFLKKHVISTDCPTGPKEILGRGKYGDLVKLEDYKSIAKKILLYNMKKSKKKLQKSLDKYNHKKNCKEYSKLINKYL